MAALLGPDSLFTCHPENHCRWSSILRVSSGAEHLPSAGFPRSRSPSV